MAPPSTLSTLPSHWSASAHTARPVPQGASRSACVTLRSSGSPPPPPPPPWGRASPSPWRFSAAPPAAPGLAQLPLDLRSNAGRCAEKDAEPSSVQPEQRDRGVLLCGCVSWPCSSSAVAEGPSRSLRRTAGFHSPKDCPKFIGPFLQIFE